jgi:hypothetical protein
MNTQHKPKRFFLEVLSAFFLLSILLPQLASATVLFSDNFDSYKAVPAFPQAEAGLAGQGGWYQNSKYTAPLILSTQTPLGSTAVDGTIFTGTGDHPSSIGVVEHPLSGPLNPHGISILSADAYAFSDLPSHNAAISIGSPDPDLGETIWITAGWYPTGVPRWGFSMVTEGNGYNAGELNGGFDQRVHVELIIDGSAGEFYGRLTSSAGVAETAHHPISASQIASLNTVNTVVLFEDYRRTYAYGGAVFDNVVVTTSSINKSFAAFIPRAEMKFGPHTKDDSFKLTSYFKLATDSNGINPPDEVVVIQFGTFSATIPTGSFQQEGQGFKYVDQAKHYGVWIQPWSGHSAKTSIQPNWAQHPSEYKITVKANTLDLDGTTVPPTVQLIIGDDEGRSKLDVGKAKFGKGKDGKHWLSDDDD